MKRYIGRSVRYLIKLVILVIGIFALMFVTGLARISAEVAMQSLLSTRGYIFMAALVVLSATYPLFGFVKRTVRADLTADLEYIVRAFNLDGYTMVSRDDETILFRASSLFKRIVNTFDDKVTVTRDGEGYVSIEGIRKEVVQAEFRIKSYVENK